MSGEAPTVAHSATRSCIRIRIVARNKAENDNGRVKSSHITPPLRNYIRHVACYISVKWREEVDVPDCGWGVGMNK